MSPDLTLLAGNLTLVSLRSRGPTPTRGCRSDRRAKRREQEGRGGSGRLSWYTSSALLVSAEREVIGLSGGSVEW